MTLRFLVLDAYPRADREALERVGGRLGGDLYCEVLQLLEPGCETVLASPADAPNCLPAGQSLGDFDGVVWSGSTLTVHERDDERVQRTAALARAGFELGVPSYGSCYAAQLAVEVAGGSCIRNPKGREFGVASDIELTERGREHPFFEARRELGGLRPYGAFQSHQDMIETLPAGAEVLATNSWTEVQAIDVRFLRGRFWAVQYHPEWTDAEIRDVVAVRASTPSPSTAPGAQRSTEAERLFSDASECPADLLTFDLRCAEARSWIDHQVRPSAAAASAERTR